MSNTVVFPRSSSTVIHAYGYNTFVIYGLEMENLASHIYKSWRDELYAYVVVWIK